MLRNLKNQNNQSYTEDITLSSELQFLIACCQVEPNLKEILSLSLKIKNWEELISMASRHGILPLVYKTLKIKELAIDTEVLRELKNRYLNISKKNMLMSAELIRIMKLLNDHNIKALAFKGPTLSQMIYGDITLRQYGDLDILVNEEDVYKAGTLIYKNGYTTLHSIKILKNKVCLDTAKDFSFISKSKVHTELHWRLFEKKYNISIFSSLHKEKYQKIIIQGKDIQTLQNELLLVYLCLHAAKHTFERIEWICDIDRLIRLQNINWDDTIILAKKSHSKRAFYLALSLSNKFFHTPLPPTIKITIKNDTIKLLEIITLKKLQKDTKNKIHNKFKKNIQNFLYQSKLYDTKLYILNFYISLIFKISAMDCYTYRLPNHLKYLYLIFRPFRLIWQNINNGLK